MFRKSAVKSLEKSEDNLPVKFAKVFGGLITSMKHNFFKLILRGSGIVQEI
ncbi:hypothetical protein [Wolbachia endosymbiont of Dirofilaria (Dirofilaria) immitis]|uniref:hypothetical protein n=1 Tax=Wolbachia endosymbiont of Dirofilaria (Dirofilaria) immitis TaxID=1812115 RepID=UPI00158D2B60|nr:hypothetical protein [Wolbachia endosymbiont of Dirofilaria (Dirofilaria) immitis]QKX02013.1 hypothetical protein GOY12_00120 [Wolbachia endosymbiont of Dirofilaria (Dirofilaria) immitis]